MSLDKLKDMLLSLGKLNWFRDFMETRGLIKDVLRGKEEEEEEEEVS